MSTDKTVKIEFTNRIINSGDKLAEPTSQRGCMERLLTSDVSVIMFNNVPSENVLDKAVRDKVVPIQSKSSFLTEMKSQN